MTDKIDSVLLLLKDEKWHLISEVAEKNKISNTRMKRITEFLEKYCFINTDETSQKVKLTSQAYKFFSEIQKME